MKRTMIALAALMLCFSFAAPARRAQGEPTVEPLALAQDVEGELRLPPEPETANYVVTYALPQFVAQSASDEAINKALGAWLDKLLAEYREQAELFAPDAAEGDAQTVELRYELAVNDARYCSVKLLAYASSGETDTESLRALTFARAGVYAGQALTLSQLTGLEEDATLAESYAARLAYEAVWQIIETQRASGQRDYDAARSVSSVRSAS